MAGQKNAGRMPARSDTTAGDETQGPTPDPAAEKSKTKTEGLPKIAKSKPSTVKRIDR
jgi:hypothetical protein